MIYEDYGHEECQAVSFTDERLAQHETLRQDVQSRGGPISIRPSPHAAVAKLGEAAMGDPNIATVFQLAVSLVCEVLDVEFAKILHQPAPNQPLVLQAGKGWKNTAQIGITTVPDAGDSQAGYTLSRLEPVLVEDLAQENRFSGPKLLIDHGVTSGISVVIPGVLQPYGVLGAHSTRRRQFTADEGDFVRAVANIIGSTAQNHEHVQRIEAQALSRDRRIGYQAALAKCAQALLASAGDDRLEQAVQALLSATHATYVFVERNEIDPELGLCSRTLLEVELGQAPITPDNGSYWDLVPWTRMPISKSILEKGEHFVIFPDELEGPEYLLYAADPDPVKSELDIPIFADGKWAGLIGFSDTLLAREWTAEDVSLLTTAAAMIGAFWERETNRERLEESLHAKNVFLASVSHELRTPLTAVLGFGHILRDEGPSLSVEERADLLDLMIAQSTDVTNIVNDLLVAAKADIGTLEVDSVPVNLGIQTRQVIEAMDLLIIAPDDEDTLRAIGDPDRIRQVIRNLLTNAKRYGGDNIRIELRNDKFARVLVCDDGIAIPDEDHERIFAPYQRAHNTPGVAGSLGLGLAISRQLAHLMNGQLTYRHENGESIFELALPLVV